MANAPVTGHEVAIGMSRLEANVILEAIDMADQIWRNHPHTHLKRGVLADVRKVLKQ